MPQMLLKRGMNLTIQIVESNLDCCIRYCFYYYFEIHQYCSAKQQCSMRREQRFDGTYILWWTTIISLIVIVVTSTMTLMKISTPVTS